MALPKNPTAFAHHLSAIVAGAVAALVSVPAHTIPAEVDKTTKREINPAHLDTSGVSVAVSNAIECETHTREALEAAGIDPESNDGATVADIVRARLARSSHPRVDAPNAVAIAIAGVKAIREQIAPIVAAFENEHKAQAEAAAKAAAAKG